MQRRWDVLLWVAALAVLLTTVIRVPVFWSNQGYMDTVAGVWSALEVDVAHGVFYRPVDGPDGFGGTRYVPVQFVLHAGVTRLMSGDLISAGHGLTLMAMVALILGAHLLLRRLGLPATTAAAAAVMILASRTAQEALLSYKGDALPAAFNVWGIAVCAAPALGTAGAVTAAVLFTLAIGTKVTTVFGLGAVLIFLWLSGQRRAAAIVLAVTLVGVGTLAAATVAASDGRVIEAWRAGAGRATSLDALFKAPFTFARLVRQVPATLLFIQLGLAALLAVNLQRPRKPDLGTWCFLATAAGMVLICSADGIDTNHLLDLHVASIVMLGVWLASAKPDARAFGIAALAVAGLAASMSLASGLMNRRAEASRGLFSEAVALVADTSRPILAENPLVPITAGQRPYMLDPFLYRINRPVYPAIEARLWKDLAAQRFGAVVLERDPHTDRGKRWYANAFFGAGFIEQMERFYEESGRVGDRIVYRPKAL
jgi:hypothetical protein